MSELYEGGRFLIGPSFGSKSATVYPGERPGTYDVTVTTDRPQWGMIAGIGPGITPGFATDMDLTMSCRRSPKTTARLALIPFVPVTVWSMNRVGDLARGVRNLARRAVRNTK